MTDQTSELIKSNDQKNNSISEFIFLAWTLFCWAGLIFGAVFCHIPQNVLPEGITVGAGVLFVILAVLVGRTKHTQEIRYRVQRCMFSFAGMVIGLGLGLTIAPLSGWYLLIAAVLATLAVVFETGA